MKNFILGSFLGLSFVGGLCVPSVVLAQEATSTIPEGGGGIESAVVSPNLAENSITYDFGTSLYENTQFLSWHTVDDPANNQVVYSSTSPITLLSFYLQTNYINESDEILLSCDGEYLVYRVGYNDEFGFLYPFYEVFNVPLFAGVRVDLNRVCNEVRITSPAATILFLEYLPYRLHVWGFPDTLLVVIIGLFLLSFVPLGFMFNTFIRRK